MVRETQVTVFQENVYTNRTMLFCFQKESFTATYRKNDK